MDNNNIGKSLITSFNCTVRPPLMYYIVLVLVVLVYYLLFKNKQVASTVRISFFSRGNPST
jgi:hypothetical protein